MYHSKRQKHNNFNLRKNARKHNVNAYNIQKNEYIKNSKNRFTATFESIISGCKYNEFKIDSKIHYNKFNYMRVIPKGNKGCVWFQSQYNYNSCVSPTLYFEFHKNRARLVDNGTDYNICCDSQTLGLGDNGTILYGTYFKHNGINFFNIEDIYYFKNRNVSKMSWSEKFNIFSEIFLKYMKQICYSKKDLIVISALTQRLPYDVHEIKDMIPYEIYSVQYLTESSDKIHYKQELERDTNHVEVFDIKASLNHDEYDIYTINNGKFVGKIYVPDYKTSVYLNKLFRNIRENDDLDLLEESDTEEDFENISLDKYVDLQKTHRVKCQFDSNMKMWKVKNASNK